MTAAQRTAAMLRFRKSLGLRDRKRRVPRQLMPTMIERSYALQLLDIVRMTHDALGPLFAALPEILASAARERTDARADADEGKRIRELVDRARDRLRANLNPTALEDLADRLGRRVAAHNRIQLGRQIQAALGVDIFIADAKLKALLDGFAAENAELIANIPEKLVGEVSQAATRAVTSGIRHEQLAKEIETRFGYGRDRARLIARDQVGKLYGQINAARQKEIGVRRFKWRTVKDIRVRGTPGGPFANANPSHYSREGKTYSYDDPPNGELPGEPILCRCYGEPEFADILEGI